MTTDRIRAAVEALVSPYLDTAAAAAYLGFRSRGPLH